MSYFDDMSSWELQRCLKYLDYKKARGMNKQAGEDERQRIQILKVLNKRKTPTGYRVLDGILFVLADDGTIKYDAKTRDSESDSGSLTGAKVSNMET